MTAKEGDIVGQPAEREPNTVEEAWLVALADTTPTVEEIAENPMQALRCFFYLGALKGADIAYRRGFENLRGELQEWVDG